MAERERKLKQKEENLKLAYDAKAPVELQFLKRKNSHLFNKFNVGDLKKFLEIHNMLQDNLSVRSSFCGTQLDLGVRNSLRGIDPFNDNMQGSRRCSINDQINQQFSSPQKKI